MIILENINKSYGKNRVLRGISMQVDTGDFISVMGSSGSGKSTLLNIIGLLDTYDSGEYFLDSRMIKKMSEKQAA